jgi:hypothetical protein
MNRAALVAALLAYLVDSICMAEEIHPAVVLLSMRDCCPDVAWPEAEKAVVDELEVVGLPVLIVQSIDAGKGNPRDMLRLIAEKHGVGSVIRIVRNPGSPGSNIEIWSRLHRGSRSIFHVLRSDEDPDSGEAQILALRTVELLRSNIGESKPDKTGESNSHRDVDRRDLVTEIDDRHEHLRPISMSLGAVMTVSPGKIGMLGSLQIAMRWDIFDELSLEFDGSYSMFGQKLGYDKVSASFDLASIRAWIFYGPGFDNSLRPCLGIGTGVILAWSEGNESDDYVSRLDYLAAGYIGISGQMAILIAKYLRMRIVVRYGYTLPEMAVRFASQEVAYFGKPMIESGISFEYQFK